MSGLGIIVPGDFSNTGWATGAAKVRQDFVGNADRAFVFDARVRSSLFQDREGTVPVTAPGQPVRRIRNRSGQGRDAILSETATGLPTWQTDGQRFWVDIPLDAAFEIVNPIRFNDFTVVAGVRFTGLSNGTSYGLLRQTGPSGNSFLAIHLGRNAGNLGVNLEITTGWELLGDPIDLGTDYVLSARRNVDTLAARCRLNGGAFATTNDFTPLDFSADQPMTGLFGIVGESTMSGRLYYVAYVRGIRDEAPIEAIASERAGVSLA